MSRSLATRIGAPDQHVWVAERRQEIVGVTAWLAEPDSVEPGPQARREHAHLAALYVRPDWWGRGVADELMSETLERMSEQGFVRARLWTPRQALQARRFYERRGWQLTETEAFLEGLWRVEYRCQLTATA